MRMEPTGSKSSKEMLCVLKRDIDERQASEAEHAGHRNTKKAGMKRIVRTGTFYGIFLRINWKSK